MNVPNFHRFLLEQKRTASKTPVAPVFDSRPVTMKNLAQYSLDLIRANPLTDTFDDNTIFKDVSLYVYSDTGEDANDLCVVDTNGADEVEITFNEANQQRGRRR